jgi:hypothetical protein
VDALRALIELNVDMTRFEVQKGHQKTPEATNCWRETWSLLLEDIKNENKVFEFFWSKSALAQRLWKKKEKELLKDMRKKGGALEEEWKRICELPEEEAKNEVLAAENDATRKVHKARVMSWLSEPGEWKGMTSCDKLKYLHDARWEEHVEEIQKIYDPERAMSKSCGFDSEHLEGVYRSLLGEKMRYQMGDLGVHLDLFFLCIIMNRRELAFELWKKCEVPVCIAICAVRLLYPCPRSVHAHN